MFKGIRVRLQSVGYKYQHVIKFFKGLLSLAVMFLSVLSFLFFIVVGRESQFFWPLANSTTVIYIVFFVVNVVPLIISYFRFGEFEKMKNDFDDMEEKIKRNRYAPSPFWKEIETAKSKYDKELSYARYGNPDSQINEQAHDMLNHEIAKLSKLLHDYITYESRISVDFDIAYPPNAIWESYKTMIREQIRHVLFAAQITDFNERI